MDWPHLLGILALISLPVAILLIIVAWWRQGP